MTKLFYTDPLKAAFMAREYGVKFTDHLQKYWLDENDLIMAVIHPDSLSIFEPQEGDVFFNCPKDKRRKIIQRDGKAFFMPEREK